MIKHDSCNSTSTSDCSDNVDRSYYDHHILIIILKLFEYVTTRIMIAYNIDDNNTARRLVLPGDLQGRSRLVDDDDDDESNWGGRIKPLLKNLQ